MSHFSVLVIGANIEKQLAPFHEFECTGVNDEFVQNVDRTDDVRSLMTGDEPLSLADALAEYSLSAVEDESQVNTGSGTTDDAPHMWGYAVVKDGQLVKAVRRTNPNKKWDWWIVGGRWTGMLALKHGATGTVGEPGLFSRRPADGRVDQAIKSDIDFEAMRDEKGQAAGETWDRAAALTGGQAWEPWTAVRNRVTSIDAARDFYNSQPAILALKKDGERFGWNIDDTLSGPRDAFVAAARDRACTTWAVLRNGEWSEKGSMGWFGMSSGDMDQAQWNRLFNDMLDGLPDDTLLTVVDCHI